MSEGDVRRGAQQVVSRCTGGTSLASVRVWSGGGVSTDYCRQSHVAFSTAGMCFVIDKSTAQYSEASPNTHTVR